MALLAHASCTAAAVDKETKKWKEMGACVEKREGEIECANLEDDGGSNCITQFTAGKSTPLAITSVDINTPLEWGTKLHSVQVEASALTCPWLRTD